ncbi:glycoside hydrolase family 88 protein [Paenibacillus sp. S150]|uniref:glycoside hydrolase family 88 protein n=1 Tax=Paenibacillus sp. S150 TaxID=2749826 RepID=UPI001C59C001|nr:glycoside hydrolase family 88 protein [Paenibacillus sp. S150]MBW4079846.1 glycoside hydrolase family 88 protein [Paenibacillus sp. S150]
MHNVPVELDDERRQFFEQALSFVVDRIDGSLPVFTELFPASSSNDLIYPAIGNTDWTASFWTGMVWLAYELTGDSKYRQAAERQLVSYRRRVEERIAVDTHDLGFLYSLSAVAAYRITGNPEARGMALEAAGLLAGRYFPEAGIIQAWGDLNDPEQRGRMIIDCLLNLPLLHWAAEETGDSRYTAMAHRHAVQSARYLIRPDHTSYHTYYMDPETGEPLYGNTHQGYADDSCWARGQAWGIYGFALSCVYTGDQAFLRASRQLADYFLAKRPADGIVYWDLIFTDGDAQEKDSSAAAIAVCGLLELSDQLPAEDPGKNGYREAALEMLHTLAERYSTKDHPHSNGILKHGVYNKPRGWGIDECTIWGDYFYCEALTRVLKGWRRYW